MLTKWNLNQAVKAAVRPNNRRSHVSKSSTESRSGAVGDVVLIPVKGHGSSTESGKAKIFATPGLVGGTWLDKRGKLVVRQDDQRCFPNSVVKVSFDCKTGCIGVDKSWYLKEQQADLRDYVEQLAHK